MNKLIVYAAGAFLLYLISDMSGIGLSWWLIGVNALGFAEGVIIARMG